MACNHLFCLTKSLLCTKLCIKKWLKLSIMWEYVFPPDFYSSSYTNPPFRHLLLLEDIFRRNVFFNQGRYFPGKIPLVLSKCCHDHEFPTYSCPVHKYEQSFLAFEILMSSCRCTTHKLTDVLLTLIYVKLSFSAGFQRLLPCLYNQLPPPRHWRQLLCHLHEYYSVKFLQRLFYLILKTFSILRPLHQLIPEEFYYYWKWKW